MLPLPDRLTPTSRIVPTAEEVAPWVEAILRLWDDAAWYEEHRQRALAESRRWAPEVLEPRYERFFRSLADRRQPAERPHPSPGQEPIPSPGIRPPPSE